MKKLILPILCTLTLFSCSKDEDQVAPPTHTTLWRGSGLGDDWDQSGSNRILYSAKGSDTYYDVYSALPDGSAISCLSCDHPLLPNKHIANSGWHPSGQWIIMVVEEATHPGSSTDALPGFGAYCDIWIMSTDKTKAYKIVEIPNDYDHGVICPRFSPDGKYIVWTDRKTAPNIGNSLENFGYQTIKLADFKFNPSDSIPIVSNIRTYEPGGNAFYESYGFSPDGGRIIFCSSMGQSSIWNQNIYTMDTLGGTLRQLTFTDYNEHGFYTPDGNKIYWMSNKDSQRGGTDWWRMNTDGSSKERMTYFNHKGNVQDAGHAVWAGLGSFSPDGAYFIGARQTSLITQEGEIMMVRILH